MEITFRISEFHLLFLSSFRIKSADAAGVPGVVKFIWETFKAVCKTDKIIVSIILFFSSLLLSILLPSLHLNVKTISGIYIILILKLFKIKITQFDNNAHSIHCDLWTEVVMPQKMGEKRVKMSGNFVKSALQPIKEQSAVKVVKAETIYT